VIVILILFFVDFFGIKVLESCITVAFSHSIEFVKVDEALVTDHFDKLYGMTERNSYATLQYLYPKEVDKKQDQDDDHFLE
jgi:hypothetical protein